MGKIEIDDLTTAYNKGRGLPNGVEGEAKRGGMFVNTPPGKKPKKRKAKGKSGGKANLKLKTRKKSSTKKRKKKSSTKKRKRK